MLFQQTSFIVFFRESQTAIFWICGCPFWLALISFKIARTIRESAARLAAAWGGPGLVVTTLLSGILYYRP